MPTSIFDLFDKELGARLRAAIVVALGVVSFLTYVLQAALDAAHFLPDYEIVSQLSGYVAAIIVGLGRFTALGDKVR
jgi:hypothetical protein